MQIGSFSPKTSLAKEGLYRILILCPHHPFWSYSVGLTIAEESLSVCTPLPPSLFTLHQILYSPSLKRPCIEFDVMRIDSAISGVHTLGDNSAFVNPAGQLLLTRRGKTRIDGVGIVFEFSLKHCRMKYIHTYHNIFRYIHWYILSQLTPVYWLRHLQTLSSPLWTHVPSFRHGLSPQESRTENNNYE